MPYQQTKPLGVIFRPLLTSLFSLNQNKKKEQLSFQTKIKKKVRTKMISIELLKVKHYFKGIPKESNMQST